VHFANSCSTAVAQEFDRGVALLHSFWFSAAIDAFHAVLEDDPSCAMAHWGIAMSWWGNPFGGFRSPQALESGLAAVAKGKAATATTERERGYIAAVEVLFRDAAAIPQRTRTLEYEKRMEQLAARYPDDTEARIFYALALDQTALPTDKTYANQLKAAGILEEEFARQPDHPGIAHYIIHSFDTPALAPRGLEAASAIRRSRRPPRMRSTCRRIPSPASAPGRTRSTRTSHRPPPRARTAPRPRSSTRSTIRCTPTFKRGRTLRRRRSSTRSPRAVRVSR
jgi:hypothetical protein